MASESVANIGNWVIQARKVVNLGTSPQQAVQRPTVLSCTQSNISHIPTVQQTFSTASCTVAGAVGASSCATVSNTLPLQGFKIVRTPASHPTTLSV